MIAHGFPDNCHPERSDASEFDGGAFQRQGPSSLHSPG
jgi:hypothetical protein